MKRFHTNFHQNRIINPDLRMLKMFELLSFHAVIIFTKFLIFFGGYGTFLIYGEISQKCLFFRKFHKHLILQAIQFYSRIIVSFKNRFSQRKIGQAFKFNLLLPLI